MFRTQRFPGDPVTSAGASASDGWLTPLRFGIFLALAFILIFPSVIVGSETFFYRDFGVIAYPVIVHHQDSFWRGELPLWNPLSNCGAPFLAQWGTMVLYPGNLFYLLLPLPWSLNVFCLVHLLLGGMGMFCLARRWAINRWAASIAGTFFVFNGVMFSCLIWPNYTVALGWMPWVVLTAEMAWSNGGKWIFICSLLAALQLLAGVPEVAVLTWTFIVVQFLIHCVQTSFAACARSIVRIALVCLLAGGLIAVQLLPFLELLEHSHRSGGISTSKWPLPIWALGNFFVPLFHSFPTAQGIYFQPGQEFFTSTYLGIPAIVLAASAVCWRRTARTVTLAGLTLGAVWMAMGEPGLLFGAVKQLVPPLNVARYPVKFLLLPMFTVPLLAAFAIAELESRRQAHRRQGWHVLLGLSSLALVGIGVVLWIAYRHPFPLDHWSATWQSGVERAVILIATIGLLALFCRTGVTRVVAGAGILVLIVADLITHVPRQNPTLPSPALAPNFWKTAQPLSPPEFGHSRAMISPKAEDHLLMSRVADPYKDLIGKRLALWSNLNLLEGIPKVNGSSTLQVREQKAVETLLYAATNRVRTQLMDFLGVAAVTAPDSILEWTNRTGSLPLITIGQAPVFASPTETFAALDNDTLDPRREVYLPLEARSVINAEHDPSAKATVTRLTAHQIEIETEASTPVMMQIAQSYYPAWRAYVDGKPTQLWRANHAFQSLEVPAGGRKVEVIYEDRKLQSGAIISGLSFAICITCLGICFRRRGMPLEDCDSDPGLRVGRTPGL